MFTLTKEQKLSNYKELLSNLRKKRTSIDAQISAVEGKIRKLESNSGFLSATQRLGYGIDDQI